MAFAIALLVLGLAHIVGLAPPLVRWKESRIAAPIIGIAVLVAVAAALATALVRFQAVQA